MIWAKLLWIWQAPNLTNHYITRFATCRSDKMSSANYQRNILSLGKQSLAGSWLCQITLPNLPKIFSPTIKFIPHTISHFQRRSSSLPLSFSVSLLSCSLPTPFDSVYKPCHALSCYQLINVFCKELFSFQRLYLHEIIIPFQRPWKTIASKVSKKDQSYTKGPPF